MRAGPTSPRWIPLCAVLLAVGQLGGMLHLALAPHGVCWEHGVVVDVDASSGVAESPVVPEGLTRAGVQRLRSDQHPHCPAVSVLRSARVESPPTAALPGVDHLRTAATGPDAVPAPRGWALERAPKQSPPV